MEGYRVVGFDIEQHVYGEHRYPAQLVLQDVLTIHGAQFKAADLIVASPPCQEFSYMAMPWTTAKQKIRDYETGVRDVKQLTALFDACFRIQREASEAAGHHIPLVVENVRGAQRWVGRARWHFGSFYLWGDVPALMPIPRGTRLKAPKVGTGNQLVAIRPDQMDDSEGVKVATMGAGWYPPDHPKHVAGLAFNGHAEQHIKNGGGSWFNIGSPGQKVTNKNPVHELAGTMGAAKVREWNDETVKGVGIGSRSWAQGKGQRHPNDPRNTWSKSPARKAASAMIAKIPLTLSRHIAASWYPERVA